MSGPLEGIRMVELGFLVAGPAAGGIFRDWGAEVIKVEPPTGDPLRGWFASASGVPMERNPPFQLDNRGKRSIVLDLQRAEGKDILLRLLAGADVFLTNLRPAALERLGLSYSDVADAFPRLVYCNVTGFGLDPSVRDKPAYDVAAIWSRSGIASAITRPGQDPPPSRGGLGDHMTAMNAAGAICAALVARGRTGRGQQVSVSLMRTGVYMMSWDLMLALMWGRGAHSADRKQVVNPIQNCFRAGDGRWFWFFGNQGDRHWPGVCRAVGKPEWIDDPRFADIEQRREHSRFIIEELDHIFASRSLDEWAPVLDREGIWWEPVQSIDQVVADPVAAAAGAFVDVTGGQDTVRMVSTPSDFPPNAERRAHA